MSSNQREEESSGKQLTKQKSRTAEEEDAAERTIITNAYVDMHSRTSTLTGDTFNPNKPNIADGFKPSQVLVNDKGEEI